MNRCDRRLLPALAWTCLSVTAVGDEPDSLKEAYRAAFRVGTALNTEIVSGADRKAMDIVLRHFDSITAENVMKAGPINPEPGEYDFAPADAFVEFGERHGMFIVGHTLVWHNQTPAWFFHDEHGEPNTPERQIERMRSHIEAVAGRYAGRVDAWDVVNEVIADDGSYRPTTWVEGVGGGDELVRHAFRFAAQYAPGAELYYNDFNAWRPAKRDGIVRMVNMLQAEGIRIDGIGMQGHWGLNFPRNEHIEAAIDAYAALGVKVMITELDVDVLPLTREGQVIGTALMHPQFQLEEFESWLDPYPDELPDAVQRQLADRYAELFRIFHDRRDRIDRVTLWGVHDAMSWKNGYPVPDRTNYPLLWDRAREAKPALRAVLDVPAGGVFLNPSFEEASPGGYPLAWYIEANDNQASVRVDEAQAALGTHALRLESGGQDPVVLYTPLLIGERCLVELAASVRVRSDAGDSSVSLFFLEPGGSPRMGGPRTGATDGDWLEAKATIRADEDCLRGDLLLGIFAGGGTRAWVDDLRVVTDEPDYRVASTSPGAAGRDVIADVRERAVVWPMADSGADGPLSGRLGERFGTARVIGLGENSHGAAALFAAKGELVRALVQRHGFTVFALEMPAGAALRVDDFVSGRSDDFRAALMALGYPAWQSREMWALVEWLRLHNSEAAVPVIFRGLDMPSKEGFSDDARMAAAALRYVADGGKTLLWADNTHVTRDGASMGGILAEELGNDYLAVGFTFDSGHYSAYGPELRYPVHPGYSGTYEHLFCETGLERFLLDLASLPAGHSLHEVRGFRYIGSSPQSFHQFYPHRLADHFDVVGFVRRTDSTEFLVEHSFR